jgi:hypothetical protein
MLFGPWIRIRDGENGWILIRDDIPDNLSRSLKIVFWVKKKTLFLK